MGFLLLLCFCLLISFSSGTDTISANQSLVGDQTLISKGENFELGFFKPSNSSNYYIGIWYKKVSINLRTIVWVANRETPISDRYNSELKIVDGNLVLLNESKFQIWSTNVTTAINMNSSTAVIRNDGNLVLTDGRSSVDPVWQSFDHPVHTWLPGSKLAYNNITKKSQSLTSWKSEENPAAGLFSLEVVPSNKEYICKWNGSQQYWTSGAWNGKIFSQVPEMGPNYKNFSFGYHENENESYFIYFMYDSNIIPRVVMSVSGQIQMLIWMENTEEWNLIWNKPRKQCQVYASCGAFGVCNENTSTFCNCLTGFTPRIETDWNRGDFSGGCVRKTDLQCGRNQKVYDFLMIKVNSLPSNSSVVVGSAGECHTICLNSCSCNGYFIANNECSIWDGELLDHSEDDSKETIYIKVASKDLLHLKHLKKNSRLPVGAVAGPIAGVAFVLGLILFMIYRKRRILVEKTTMEGSLVVFAYRDLQVATKNFSDKLGGGGFGSVFKGVLRDSSIVAVKRLEGINQGEKQFRTEVSTIGTIQHVDLVRLRGFCVQGNSKLLVYDYMPNGSLDSHLFHDKEVLSWKTRYQIALGIARGLVYLHEKCRDCIIHCDIKPENILLDADFIPKIADFGLAKLVGRDFSRVLTTIRGTRGYLAPEWLSGVAVTAKADVFSYGMMLFELVHGKRNAKQSEDDPRTTFFPSFVANILIEGGDILSLLDSRLNREASVEEVTKICKVACWCIQDDQSCRPNMSMVEQILEGVLDVNMPPIPRSVKLLMNNTEHVVFFIESSSNGNSQVPSNSSTGDSQS